MHCILTIPRKRTKEVHIRRNEISFGVKHFAEILLNRILLVAVL